MSTLRSALDELRAQDLRSLSDEALADRMGEIERVARILEAECGRGLAELERRRVFAADGHLSAAAWLAHRQGLSRRAAEAAVRRARSLERMPAVARALGEGEVSSSAVGVLARAQEAAPEALARSENALVEAARSMAHSELRSLTETWKAAADPGRAIEEEDLRHERRSFDVCPDPDGMVRGRLALDREDGQTLITAIRAQMDAWARSSGGPDPRTPTQRRADALGGRSAGSGSPHAIDAPSVASAPIWWSRSTSRRSPGVRTGSARVARTAPGARLARAAAASSRTLARSRQRPPGGSPATLT